MNENIDMKVSSIIRKDGDKAIYVLFSEDERSCEFVLPEKKLLSNHGFREDEIMELTDYITNEADSILDIAKNVDPMKGFMGLKQG